MFMTTGVGAVALAGVGTIHGYGTEDGAGTTGAGAVALAGVGTTHGYGTAGAGAVASVGAAASVGVGIGLELVMPVFMVVVLDPIMAEVSMDVVLIEVLPSTEPDEDMLQELFQALHCEPEGLT